MLPQGVDINLFVSSLRHFTVVLLSRKWMNSDENVQYILTYGAQALFELGETSRDITCKF